jgi:hypothetical protein
MKVRDRTAVTWLKSGTPPTARQVNALRAELHSIAPGRTVLIERAISWRVFSGSWSTRSRFA